MNKKIGVLDSGIGGTTVLKEIIKLLPKEDYVYYADSKHNPYGEKTQEEIYNIVNNIVDYLINKKDCKIIVIACNTATTRCMKQLKEKYKDTPFVGTVPAIKVACDNNYKKTLVLATPATIESERTHELVVENKKEDQEIILKSCDGLANAIETKDNNKINTILQNIKKDVLEKDIDSIVLGCTHYPLIKEDIKKYFPNTKLLDGSLGVAKEVKRQLENNNLLNTSGYSRVEYINSKEQ